MNDKFSPFPRDVLTLDLKHTGGTRHRGRARWCFRRARFGGDRGAEVAEPASYRTQHGESRIKKACTLESRRLGRGTHLEPQVLEDDLLDVAADGGRGSDGLAEVELVERGGLAGVVEPHDDELVLLRREHQEPHPRHPRPHLFSRSPGQI
jgi:hypothetical protein